MWPSALPSASSGPSLYPTEVPTTYPTPAPSAEVRRRLQDDFDVSFLDQEMLATLLDPALPRIDERPCPQGFSCVRGLLFACTDGESFAPSEGSSSCSTCGTCLTGQLVLQACTRESDTVCSSCPRFSTERGDKCVCDNNLSLNDRDEAV